VIELLFHHRLLYSSSLYFCGSCIRLSGNVLMLLVVAFVIVIIISNSLYPILSYIAIHIIALLNQSGRILLFLFTNDLNKLSRTYVTAQSSFLPYPWTSFNAVCPFAPLLYPSVTKARIMYFSNHLEVGF
jgi:hypothetical protein